MTRLTSFLGPQAVYDSRLIYSIPRPRRSRWTVRNVFAVLYVLGSLAVALRLTNKHVVDPLFSDLMECRVLYMQTARAGLARLAERARELLAHGASGEPVAEHIAAEHIAADDADSESGSEDELAHTAAGAAAHIAAGEEHVAARSGHITAEGSVVDGRPLDVRLVEVVAAARRAADVVAVENTRDAAEAVAQTARDVETLNLKMVERMQDSQQYKPQQPLNVLSSDIKKDIRALKGMVLEMR
ncbi:uncharacterized protein V1510DRAFT_423788 [Dipodascopsis tothii]|uniref:uncharacterized protein n=1 Tax=Dipodascopsis tothii TaxID=44089 RepID=UPI0034CE4021